MSHFERARGRLRQLRAYDASAVTAHCAVDCGNICVTQQQFREEVDVNTIVKRFGFTGQQPASAARAGVYGDFTGIFDYDSAVARIEAARAGFMSLPAEVREEFDNDPGKFVRFAQEVGDDALVEEYGLKPLPPEAPAAPEPSPAASEPGNTGA